MQVNNQSSQATKKPQSKLDLIKAERNRQKQLKKQEKLNQQKAALPEDKVELELKTKVRDKEKTVIGDIGANLPDDPHVHTKLKNLLDSGAFKFNNQEREVLTEILDDKTKPGPKK